MSNEAETTEKKPRQRAPQYVAAKFHADMARVEASIALAKETIKDKTAELEALHADLAKAPEVVRSMVAGMRSASAPKAETKPATTEKPAAAE